MIYKLDLSGDSDYKQKHRCRLREIIDVPGIGKVRLASVHPPLTGLFFSDEIVSLPPPFAGPFSSEEDKLDLIGLMPRYSTPPVRAFLLHLVVNIGVPQKGHSWEEGPYDFLAIGELTWF